MLKMNPDFCQPPKPIGPGGMGRAEAVLPDSVTAKLVSVNERILNDVHALYADADKGALPSLCGFLFRERGRREGSGAGLVRMGAAVGLELAAPRRKVSILLLGNHSAGKSTFINWYRISFLGIPFIPHVATLYFKTYVFLFFV